ncbi:MAG: TPM domain-containing protein [Candidatus Doudnabacteria bacterium]
MFIDSRKNFIVTLLSAVVLLTASQVFAYTKPGNPSGFVNDFAGIFSAEQKQNLETKLSAYEKQSTNEVSVVTVKNLGGDYIENYAVELFKDFGIGKKDKNNGLLLLIALEDREMRIEIGYGLEGELTDAQSASIIRNVLTPAFQKGDYYGGVNEATDLIIKKLSGEQVNIPVSKPKVNINFNLIFFLFFFVFSFLSSVLARSKSWWAGGIVGALCGGLFGLFLGTWVYSLVMALLFTPIGLLFDYVVSKNYEKGKKTGVYPWWIGGGRSGGSGGGFGGFGGGFSGGGGSSGRW